MHSSDAFIPKYSELVYNGFRFSSEREALQALVTETQRDVTGVVRLKLYKGNIIVVGRKSPKSLYDPKIATMEGDTSSYDQTDATGFIRLNALRLKLRAVRNSFSQREKSSQLGRIWTLQSYKGAIRFAIAWKRG
jgi:argininosuccinate synthase